jgi:hypothetical protein
MYNAMAELLSDTEKVVRMKITVWLPHIQSSSARYEEVLRTTYRGSGNKPHRSQTRSVDRFCEPTKKGQNLDLNREECTATTVPWNEKKIAIYTGFYRLAR